MRQVPLLCRGFDDTGRPGSRYADGRFIACVTPAGRLASLWQPDLQFLVPMACDADHALLGALQTAGIENLIPVIPPCKPLASGRTVQADPEVLQAGDVVALEPARRYSEVLMRVTDQHHTVFLTNRCNSRCVMCSQPPTNEADHWRAQEALEVLRHMSWSPPVIGFSGGEPLLLGEGLRHLLMATVERHPASRVEVLTNGRLAANEALAQHLFGNLPERFCWMVPLYGHAPFLHDYVVQAEGAFEETVCGLLNLQRYRQPVQLRVVLIRPVLEILPDLADFIARNLPFVREVALMGCEPIGFALSNRTDCEVDLLDWQDGLQAAVRRLERGAVQVILMNTPLCGLKRDLWPLAHRSISDWKKTYARACDPCVVREECCGLFEWHQRGWKPTGIRAISSRRRGHEEATA